MYIEQTMVQSVVRIVQPHMECRKHKNIPLVPLAKNIVTKTDALVTGASLVYRVYGWCHSRVFTAEWLRIKPIREATKLCTQHCTGECVSISKCDYAMPTQSNRSKGEKKKAMWQAPRLFAKSHDVAQTPLRATEPSPKQFMRYSAPKGA